MTEHVVIDFETYPIKMRPEYPPRPVGLATKWPGQPGTYRAFGHVSGSNNCDVSAVDAELHRVWDSGLNILCHHGKFDIEVACRHFGLQMLPWDRLDDTEYLAFLHDPHAWSLELKKLAQQHLGMDPEERDRIVEWCQERKGNFASIWHDYIAHELPEPFTPSRVGQWIWFAPGNVVGPYAIGDLDRTEGLWRFYAATRERMGEAYDRERRLMPILLENEQAGLRVDLSRLERDIETLTAGFDAAEDVLRQVLQAPSLNLDADQEVAERLNTLGIVTEWTMTKATKAHPQGLRSMSKETLTKNKYHDQSIFQLLGYRNRLKTTLGTFMRPWAAQARVNGGRISTTWNQVRNPDGGTRTGRPSCTEHNLLNVAKNLEGRASDGWTMPDVESLPSPPLCRDYVLPEEGHLWLHRDFSGQEVRMFAHFESGDLMRAYLENPDLDPHAFTKARIMDITGKELERTRVKNGTFSRLYGGGVHAVQWQAQCKSQAEAKELIELLDQGMPGRKIVEDVIKTLSRLGMPIVTWGGRWYYAEKLPGRDLTYKLLNYLVQGSSADDTKQTLIDWYAQSEPWERFLVTVYDEINISAPAGKDAQRAMGRLKTVMETDRLSVPMRSDGKVGTTWGNAIKEKDWSW